MIALINILLSLGLFIIYRRRRAYRREELTMLICRVKGRGGNALAATLVCRILPSCLAGGDFDVSLSQQWNGLLPSGFTFGTL